MKIGVLGGGQLGWMLAMAGQPLGLSFRFLRPGTSAPADGLGEVVSGDYTDPSVLERFAAGLDVATYEFENVPAAAAVAISKQVGRFFPSPDSLHMAQDRLTQREFLSGLGIPVPTFAAAGTREEFERAVQTVSLPCIVKTRTWGYDGKGQVPLYEPGDVARAWDSLSGAPLILERRVHFSRELSLIAARSSSGEEAYYPLVENVHERGILRVTRVPAPASEALTGRARDIARRIMSNLSYVGVLAVELFEESGELLVNEIATRVHNSGHWSIDGAVTSQFENHLRAILGWPLGSTRAVGPSTMFNLIGNVPPVERLLAVPGAHLHIYGKSAAPGRKLGHVTVSGPEAGHQASAEQAMAALLSAG